MAHNDIDDTEATIDRLCTVEEAKEVRKKLEGRDARDIYARSRKRGASHQQAMGDPFRVEC